MSYYYLSQETFKKNLHTRLRPLLGTFVDRMKPLAQFWRATQTCWFPLQGVVSGSRTGGKYMLILCRDGCDKGQDKQRSLHAINPSHSTTYALLVARVQEGIQFVSTVELGLLGRESSGLLEVAGEGNLVALG